MATLESLKQALRQKATSPTKPLTDEQYSAGFGLLLQGPGWTNYQDFIIPQLSHLLTPLFNSRVCISVLEVGPGPKSVLGHLPGHLRRKIATYTAFEPNILFAAKLEQWLCPSSETESPLPCLQSPPNIHRTPFALDSCKGTSTGIRHDEQERFDVVLFCHSMYGINGKLPERKFVERALEMLAVQPEGGVVVVFHRDGTRGFDGLVCHQTAPFPAGIVRVADDNGELDRFASFIAGFVMQDKVADEAIHDEWRKLCRAMGHREEAHPRHLSFSAPDVMMAFTQHATLLQELEAQVPLAKGDRNVKSWEARLHRPAAVVRPTEIGHVQQCVRWALKRRVGLTVVGGGHSGHCLWSHVVAVDMEAFDQVHILPAGVDGRKGRSSALAFVVAEAGCKSGDVIRKTTAVGLTVPLGSRPSVGAGLWLQGGVGHLARLHGLSCDAIVGAVVVSVGSAQVLCVGLVPDQHWPRGAVRPTNDAEMLWAIKGAGTNVGIIISVVFEAYEAPTYCVRNWIVPLSDSLEARRRLDEFDTLVASKLPRTSSADAYLYFDAGRLHLGMAMIETRTGLGPEVSTASTLAEATLGPACSSKVVDGVGLFDAEMYVSVLHGGHGGGKTSSFKRCLFLKHIGSADVAEMLVRAVESRPTALCYLHLLQGGGAIADVAPEAAAFGCRDWDFACVVTGVWPRDRDGTEDARAAVRWVYDVARHLLPLSSGAYGADLGPDPRDSALAARAFGPNRPRLARLKRGADPCNLLAYGCPLPQASMGPRLIILVTGDSGAGKDWCADVWASVLNNSSPVAVAARVVSISDATKREYAAATGADLNALLQDRAYKEQHRPALTAFFQDQVRRRPQLPEEHFLGVVHGVVDADVLLITGMRDEAPVAALSHLVTDSRVLEVCVKASRETLYVRRGRGNESGASDSTILDWCPSFIFNNDTDGSEAAEQFAQRCLVPFLHEDLQRLASMIRSVPDFPRPGIEFRHVLGICRQPGGLALCTRLLQSQLGDDWAKTDAVVCCEAGGFVFASPLAERVGVPLVLIREAGKLPPPTVSVVKPSSHVSRPASDVSREKRIEMERDAVQRGASVVVVDDVLATGETLCAVLQLLGEAGISAEQIGVLVVAEFPAHRGRRLLRHRGFGRVDIRSLLVFGGV
ncbi:Adenine phosphoribosyltransferase [Trichoderma ghanense]|uniref:Adenine phosphoribosyltransferase n=1 Tax=Trichoderma ghanense TaxID=65468 RepID=A0ABY2H5D5_9HYPO